MGKDYSYLCILFLVFMALLPFVFLISMFFTTNMIIPWVIIAGILSISMVMWKYHREIVTWYKTRERKKAEKIGKKLGLPVKIKIGKAERIYPSRGLFIPPEWSFFKSRNIEIYCKGNGTRNDPYVIDGSFHIPKRLAIYNESQYYHVENLKLKKIGLMECENFTFNNCELKEFRLKKCTNISIKELIVIRESRLKDCQNVTFEKSLMKNIILYKSNDGLFKNCFIVNLKDWMSKNNNFENVIIETLHSNKKAATFSKGNILNDTEIRKSSYKIKKLFQTSLKKELSIIVWTICFSSFTFIGLGILFWLNELEYDVWYWYLIIPGNFAYFLLIAIVGFYINEYHFKLKLKKRK